MSYLSIFEIISTATTAATACNNQDKIALTPTAASTTAIFTIITKATTTS